MKGLILNLCLLILFSCTHLQPKVASDSKNLSNIETLPTTKNDSTELIFDFYSKFYSNTDFQINRIKFPLKVVMNNQISTVQKKDWKHDYLFSTLQYVTYITDFNNPGIDYSADYGDRSVFSWIYPSLNKKKDYYFIRENSQWHLEKIVINSQNSQEPESFIKFLQMFMNDSIFQISRIKFPIKISTWTGSEEDSKDTTYLKQKSEWRFITLYNGLDSLTNFSNNWDSDIKDNNQFNIFIGGLGNGISVDYYFQKIENKWFFIELKDYSN
jgi:hypothetical protein